MTIQARHLKNTLFEETSLKTCEVITVWSLIEDLHKGHLLVQNTIQNNLIFE